MDAERRPGHPAGRIRAAMVVALAVLLAAGCAATSTASPAPSPVPTLAPTPSPDPSTATQPITAPTVSPAWTPDPTATPPASPAAVVPPTAEPTPRPTPRPTATPAPAAASRLVRHGSRARPLVALTFDMGGRVGDALAIVAWLVEHDTSATIFMTGAMADNVNTDVGRQVLAVIEANPSLLSLGNHSYSHPDFRSLKRAQMRDELRRTEAAVSPYCSQDPKPLFRPPYGGSNANVLAGVGAAGYARTVMWDVDTIDWRPVRDGGPTTDEIVAKVVANARGGSIVLMHLGGYHTLAALPRIVDGLRAAGLEFVSLDTMLGT